jgi:large subunit ribosomal protein L10e
MGLRPGHCYSSKKDRAFTRYAVKVHRKSYTGAIPGLKTRQFNMGNGAKEFSHILDLKVEEHCQIRDNAIESVRMAINRYLNNHLGKEGYFMKIRAYPFHVLRENKQAQGAGADRVSQGMSHSFGKNIGRAIRVRPGQKLISVLVDEDGVEVAKKALQRANSRIGAELSIRVGTDVKSIGTRPKKTRDIIKAEKEAAAKKKEEEEAKEGEKKEGKEAGKEDKKEEGKGEKKEEKKEGAKEEKRGYGKKEEAKPDKKK